MCIVLPTKGLLFWFGVDAQIMYALLVTSSVVAVINN